MPDGALIIASSLSGPCAVLRGDGHDPSELLPDPSGALTAEARLSLRSFVEFFQIAALRTGDAGFGWRAGRVFDLATLGETGEAVARAPTLGAALVTFCRAFTLVQTDSLLELTVDGGEAVLGYRILDPRIWPRDQDAEFTLAILAGLVASVAGPGWRPLRIDVEHAPNRAVAAAESGPRCAVIHRAGRNALRFPAGLLDREMPEHCTSDWRARIRRLEAEAAELARRAPLDLRLRREILMRLDRGGAREQDVAGALGLSERSLRRRLAEQGQRYAAVLGICRVEAARQLLAVEGLKVADIAERLGYSDLTAFERAFRRSEGVTPAQFRRGLSQPN